MNEDFTNSNSMDGESIDCNSIDKELQVRLMNLVLGEASDFELDQLQLLMEQRVEVATYYQHLIHLHGLLCEAAVGEPSMDVDETSAEDTWQLSPDRREQVLAVLDNHSHNPQVRVTLAKKSATKRWRMTIAQVVAVSLAACVLIGLMLPAVQSARESARRIGTEFSRSAMPGGTEDSLFLNDSAPSPSPGPATVESLSATVWEAEQAGGIGSPNVLYSQSIAAAGRPSDLESRSISDSVAEFESSASGYSAPDARFAFPVAPASPAVDGLAMNGGRQSSSLAGIDFGDSVKNPEYGMKGVDDLSSQNQVGRAAVVPAKPDSKWLDHGLSKSLSSAVDSPKLEVPAWEDVHVPAVSLPRSEQSYAATVPDGGTILLGGIRKTREVGPRDRFDNNWYRENDSSSTFAQTVTPRIIIEEEEGEKYYRQVPQTDGEPQAAMQVDGNKTLDQYPANLSAVVSAPQESAPVEHLAESASVAAQTLPSPYYLKDDVQYFSAGESKRDDGQMPPADNALQATLPTAENGLFGDVQVDFVDEIDLAILRGSKRDVERTLDVLDKLKESSIAEKTSQMEQLAESSDKISKGNAAKGSGLGDSLSSTLEPAGGDHSLEASKDVAPEVEKIDTVAVFGARVKDSIGKGSPESEDTNGGEAARGWMFKPAPSPELASKARSRVAAEGKSAAPKQAAAVDEQTASAEAFSTFSLHVSDVSFKLAQTALSQGQWPEAAKIRIEEFVNAIDYHDPLPSGNQRVACRVEQAIHPFLMQRNLLRVSMRTSATGRSQNTPLRLTLLLDNSGSMERPDRRQAVLRAFQTLTAQLRATDQVTLISFASTPRLLADKVPGNQGEALLQLVENLPSEGGTNIEAALLLAREKAAEQQLAGAQNRIVLLTDGAVNLGNANPESLATLVTQLRDAGIAFDAAGISAQDLNDEVLEALTRQGDGRYYLLDSAESVGEEFAAQIAGALRPSAQNVKVQVEFNPQRVGRYKLLGFEKHRLNKEDFRNDQVDAAEMAAAEAGVAMYQFEIKPNGSGDVGNVSVRFRDLSTGQMVERRWPIPYEPNAPRLEQADASMQLAASAALFAAKLSGGPLADSVDLADLQKLLSNLSEQWANQPRVQQLRSMIDQAKAIGH